MYVVNIDRLSMILSYNLVMTRRSGRNENRIGLRLNAAEYEQLLVLADGRTTSDVVRELIRKAYSENQRPETG